MQIAAMPSYFSLAEVNIDIYDNTAYGADIKDYTITDGKYQMEPSILQSGGAKALISVSICSLGAEEGSMSYVIISSKKVKTCSNNDRM